MFWVGGVGSDRVWQLVGGLHDTADDKVVKVVRDGTNRNRLAPGADVNRPNAYKEANVRVSIGT